MPRRTTSRTATCGTLPRRRSSTKRCLTAASQRIFARASAGFSSVATFGSLRSSCWSWRCSSLAVAELRHVEFLGDDPLVVGRRREQGSRPPRALELRERSRRPREDPRRAQRRFRLRPNPDTRLAGGARRGRSSTCSRTTSTSASRATPCNARERERRRAPRPSRSAVSALSASSGSTAPLASSHRAAPRPSGSPPTAPSKMDSPGLRSPSIRPRRMSL